LCKNEKVTKMLKLLCLLACASLSLAHQPSISETLIRLPNGDESEIVKIDLRKRDGTEDIKLMAHVRFHLDANQIYVNGQPVRHNVVTQLRMRVTIVEIENGVASDPRLAPVTFRVLVLENRDDADGSLKQIIVEEEFIKVEENEVMQVDVKQVVWDGVNRRPSVSILYKDSLIQHRPIEEDHRVFVTDKMLRPHLPNERDYMGPEFHHHHRHHHGHWRIMCWFRRLSVFGKIAVGCAGIVTLISLVLSAVLCWRRHCTPRTKAVVLVPMDNNIIVDNCTDNNNDDMKKIPTTDNDDEFHIQMDDCFIEISDKKKLVE